MATWLEIVSQLFPERGILNPQFNRAFLTFTAFSQVGNQISRPFCEE
jgi:hypothetical protein